MREEKSCDGRRCPELPDNWQLISVSSQAEHFLINSVPVSSVSAAPGYPSRVPASPHQQPNLQNNITTELSLQIDIISSWDKYIQKCNTLRGINSYQIWWEDLNKIYDKKL